MSTRNPNTEARTPAPAAGAILFSLGQLLMTPGARDALADSNAEPLDFISRHARGDWGDLSDEDKRENDYSVGRCLRIFSAYHTRKGVKIWIITEADRSATTILLPSEY